MAENDPDAYLWVVGVVLVLLGSLGQNLGNNLVSLAHSHKNEESKKISSDAQLSDSTSAKLANLNALAEVKSLDIEKGDTTTSSPSPSTKSSKDQIERIDQAEKGSIVAAEKHSTLWYIGTTFFVLGSLLTFAAFGFAAQSLLASLESIQFVSNVLFAKYVHGESITWKMCIATVSIVAGNSLVVVFSTHTAAILDSREIIRLYLTNQPFLGYVIGSFIIWVAAEYTFVTYNHGRMVLNVRYWKHGVVEPIAYVTSSAIIGAVAVLNAKCMSMLIQISVRGIVNEFTLAPLWVILGTWILFVAYWLRRLDKGLELFPPLFFIPVIQVAFITFAIIIGGIYYEEFNAFTWQQWIGFSFGVFMILAGVYGLAPTNIDSLSIVPVDYDPASEVQQGRAVSPTTDLLCQEADLREDQMPGTTLRLDTADPLTSVLSAQANLSAREKPSPVTTPINVDMADSPVKNALEAEPSTPVSLKKARKVVKHGTPSAVSVLQESDE